MKTMNYKILINESGVLKLVEVPEKPTRGDVSFHTGKNLGAKLIEYEQALSAALADKSKHIEFKDESYVKKIILKEFYKGRKTAFNYSFDKNETFDLPENVSVSIIYQLKNVNGDWVDLPKRCEYPEDSTHRKLAILTPITDL